MKYINLNLEHKEINYLQDDRISTNLKIELPRKIQLKKFFDTQEQIAY